MIGHSIEHQDEKISLKENHYTISFPHHIILDCELESISIIQQPKWIIIHTGTIMTKRVISLTSSISYK